MDKIEELTNFLKKIPMEKRFGNQGERGFSWQPNTPNLV